MKLAKHIRSIDVYGKKVTLKFNKKGDSQKTYIGGLCTVFTTLIFLIYCFQKLISASDNATTHIDKRMINPDSLNEVKLS